MLDGLETVRWDLEAQPPWNEKDSVANALRALSVASSDGSDEAYSRMLYALGNNHAGTYYPVALAAVPFLGAILREGGPTARLRALDVLIDLVGSFEPEPGFETIATSGGRHSLSELLKNRVLDLAVLIEHRRLDAASPEESKMAQDLLALLRE
jgi:hypothetical protein